MRKLMCICIICMLSITSFSMKVKHYYDVEKIQELFKSDGIVTNTNGVQLNGYDWGISLIDIREESENEQRKIAIMMRLQQDGYKFIDERNGVLNFENDKFVQSIAVEKIVVIVFNKKNSNEKIIKQLEKLLSAKI